MNKIINDLKILEGLKKMAIAIAYKGGEEKEFKEFWDKFVSNTTFPMGQLAEIVYVYILAILSYQTNKFRISCSWKEDRDKIDFRVNGYPIQVKTNFMEEPFDADYCKRHNIALIKCFTAENGETIIRKLAIPFAISEEKMNAMAEDFDPTIDVINYIWSWFAKRSGA